MNIKLIELFIQDFKNFVSFVNGVSQILMLSYNCICDILYFKYGVCVNGMYVFMSIKSGIILNWNYIIICSLMIIIRMYSDKCDDIYEMYNFEKQKNTKIEKNNNMLMFEKYRLIHHIKQSKVNSEIQIKLIMYDYDSSLYTIYDTFLDINYNLNHKCNQLLINKYIETNSNNLFKDNPK